MWIINNKIRKYFYFSNIGHAKCIRYIPWYFESLVILTWRNGRYGSSTSHVIFWYHAFWSYFKQIFFRCWQNGQEIPDDFANGNLSNSTVDNDKFNYLYIYTHILSSYHTSCCVLHTDSGNVFIYLQLQSNLPIKSTQGNLWKRP